MTWAWERSGSIAKTQSGNAQLRTENFSQTRKRNAIILAKTCSDLMLAERSCGHKHGKGLKPYALTAKRNARILAKTWSQNLQLWAKNFSQNLVWKLNVRILAKTLSDSMFEMRNCDMGIGKVWKFS